MYKFGFGLQPVIDGLAMSHSTLDVKFVKHEVGLHVPTSDLAGYLATLQ